MTQTPPAVCPHLGLVDDRTLTVTEADSAHRCFAQKPPGAPDEAYQNRFCLSRSHPNCPFYTTPPAKVVQPPVTEGRPAWQTLLVAVAAIVVLVIVGIVYGSDLLRPRTQPPAAESGVAALQPALTQPAAAQANTATVQQAPAANQPAAIALAAQPSGTRYATPTAEPQGKVISALPRPGEVGWWATDDTRANHLGDSFLYAGYFDSKVFVAAIRFDLRDIPRGAPLRAATLRLTGLQTQRFASDAGGTWSVQLLAADAVDEMTRADFQKVFNAPSAATLFPALQASDMAAGATNSWDLDPGARDWLAQQINTGITSMIVRIVGPVGGKPTLFAWDSGAGAGSSGAGPALVVSLGPAPDVPPPLPTQPLLVAVATQTPANIMTAAAYALRATTVAATIGTFTPMPGTIVTPTPIPANLATAQALGLREGFAPLVVYTPTPANDATATANAIYATAVAVTTGTFTPVPTNAVTPLIVQPTPMPENVMTAAAQSIAATARAQEVGTPTPLPIGAVVATITPGQPYVLFPTETPANAATVAARVSYATAVAMTTGTFTPPPPGGMTPTPAPPPTPLPLIVGNVTPRPTPTMPSGAIPQSIHGKILFHTNRDGGTATYMLDPATGRVSWVTQDWPWPAAQATEGNAPDGKRRVIVRTVPTGFDARGPNGKYHDFAQVAQLIVLDSQYNTEKQLTHDLTMSYDPAWSPAGDTIVYVSTVNGNDEIYTMDAEGSNATRLTHTTWEWNKHPTWSPDGKQIVFMSNRVTGRRQLWIMNADGSNQRQLIESAYDDWDPIWVK